MGNDSEADSKRLKKAWKDWGKDDTRVGTAPNSYKAFLRWLAESGSSFADAAKRILEGK